MAVIFVHLFIYKTYYVSSKYTTNSSVNYSKNNYTCCHVIFSFVSISYMVSRGYLYKQNITVLTWLKPPNHLNLAKLKCWIICLFYLLYHITTIHVKNLTKQRIIKYNKLLTSKRKWGRSINSLTDFYKWAVADRYAT